MAPRKDPPETPLTSTELGMKVLGEKDRLEGFMKMMKK